MRQIVLAKPDGVCSLVHNSSEVSDLLSERGNIIWWDVGHPEIDDLRTMRSEFGFHPLAIEDALHRQYKPKIDIYEDYYFMVFHTVRFRSEGPATEHKIRTNQIALFLGHNYMVTVHIGYVPEVEQTIERWRNNHEAIGHSVAGLAHALLDTIIDAYFPVIDHIAEHVEELEEQIFENFQEEALPAVFTLKKDLLHMRRVVAPGRDVINTLLRRDKPIFPRESIVYFQDLYDHLVRVADSIDTYRDLLSSAVDSYLSVASNRMNQTMRVLTSSSIILMSMALIAGIYGMNFKAMPELEWGYGYPFAIALMVVIGLALVAFFRRKGWL